MSRKVSVVTLTVTLLLALLLPAGGLLAQGGTPITPANAAQVAQIARFGRGRVMDVSWSPDGQTLLLAGSVGLWQYNANDLNAQPALITGFTDTVLSATYSPDGLTIATGDEERLVRLWDAQSGAERLSLESETRLGYVRAVVFSPDGSVIAAGDDNNNIHLWDTATGEELTILAGHEGGIRSLAFSPDGATLASGSDDDTVRLWDMGTAAETAVFEGHENNVLSVAFSPDGTLVASSSWDDTVRVWNVATGTEVMVLEAHDSDVYDVAFSPDGTLLASAGEDDVIRVWIVDTWEERDVLEGHTNGVSDIAFSPDGSTLASIGFDEAVLLWDLASGAQVASAPGHTDEVGSVAINPAGTLILAGSDDNTVRLWSVTGGDADPVFEGEGHQSVGVTSTIAAFSPDGSKFASAGGFTVYVYDTATGYSVSELDDTETGLINGFAFSPDGAIIAVTTWDGPVLLWDVQAGELLTRLEGHVNGSISVAFSADGSLIASSGNDGTVRLWGLGAPTAAAATEEPTEEVVAGPTPTQAPVVAGGAPTMVPYTLGNISFTYPQAWTVQEAEPGLVSFLSNPNDTMGTTSQLMLVSDRDVLGFGATLDEMEVNIGEEITTVTRMERATVAGYPALIVAGTDQSNVYADVLGIAEPGGPYVVVAVGGPAGQQAAVDAIFQAVLSSLSIGATTAVPTQVPVAAGGGPITYGQTVTGEITDASYQQDWTFTGSAGDVVTITMQRTSGDLDTLLVLIEDPGIVLAENDDAATQIGDSQYNSQIEPVALTVDGTFTIRATRFGRQNGFSTGAYSLTLEGGAAGGAGAAPGGVLVNSVRITLDQSITGSWNEIDAVELVGAAADGTTLRQWASEANASSWYGGGDAWAPFQATGAPDTNECGDQVTAWASATYTGQESLTLIYTTPVIPTEINIYQTYNPGAITRVEVLAADRSGPIVVFSGVDSTTACPGVFTVQVSGGGASGLSAGALGALGGGSGGGGGANTVAYGQTVTGEITAASFQQDWTFAGNAGDVVTITMQRTSGDLDSYLFLLDSAGVELTSNDDAEADVGDTMFNSQIANFTLPTDGTYTIRATRFLQQGGGTTGAYTLTLETGSGSGDGK